MIHPIPSIVVVDSDKAPEDQLRTMIILFRPTDSEVLKRGRNPGNDNKKETVNKSYHQKKLSRKGSLEERAKRRGTVNSNQSSNINNNNLNKSLSNSLTGLKTLNKTQLEKKIANRKQTQKRKFRSNENLDLCQQQQPTDFKETLRFRNFSRQKSVSTSQDSLIYGHIQSDWNVDSPSSNSDVEDLVDSGDQDSEDVSPNRTASNTMIAEDRQGQMERSNSITLEQRENEAKERIINIFNMRSKIQKWKNNTQDNNKKEEREPSYKNCDPTGSKLSESDLHFCLRKTRFNKKVIRNWFKNFRSECPNGKLSRSHLYDLFAKIFPTGNAESFCDHIFRIFDSDGNNFLDFKEFLMALDIAQCTDERQRLEWSFRMWDVDDSGCINLQEMTNIVATMDDVEGVEQEPKPGQLFGRLSARMRAKEIFDRLDVDGDGEITKTEFVEGYLRLMK